MGFDAEKHSYNFQDYDRPRSEIKLNEPEICLGSTKFQADEGANKLVAFQPSSLKEDAAQTIFPFFDAQDVDMNPAMPLNGIGLFYKSAPKCGGYIVPRLFTNSLDRYMDYNDAMKDIDVTYNSEIYYDYAE